MDSAAWLWSKNKKSPKLAVLEKFTEAEKSSVKWKAAYFKDGLNKTLNELAIVMENVDEDKYFYFQSKTLNGYEVIHKLEKDPNGWSDRKTTFSKLKTWFKYDKNVCKNEINLELSGKVPWMEIAWKEYERYKGLNNNLSPLKGQVEIYFDNANYKTGKFTENWCAAFVTWCLTKGTFRYPPPSGLGTIRARAFAPKAIYANDHHWEEGKQTKSNTPGYGAIALIKWENGGEHVAFVIGKTSTGRIAVLGGNQSVKENGVKIGSGITKSSAKLSEIKCFTYPSLFSDYTELYNLTSENITDSLTSLDTHQ